MTGSTAVNKTSSTFLTSGAQIRFLYKAKPAGMISPDGWLISTFPTAIFNIAYKILARGVWMCVFQGTGINFATTQSVLVGLSTTIQVWIQAGI